jgi:hypothetical protein
LATQWQSNIQQFFDKDLDSKRPYSENVLGKEELEGTVYGYNYTGNGNRDGGTRKDVRCVMEDVLFFLTGRGF